VRGGSLLTHFPPIDTADFGLSPSGISTRPAAVPQMLAELECSSGPVRPDDLLFVATDAMAHWMLAEIARDQAPLWTLLAELDHDATFAALVADQRAAGRLRNDDVTLLRVQLGTAGPR